MCSEIMYVRFDRAPVSQTDVVYNIQELVFLRG
jgi:hypothetical protein